MADKLMYILNDDTQNYPFLRLQIVSKGLNIQLNETTNHNILKDPKVVEATIKKTDFKTLGTIVVNSLTSPPSLEQNEFSLPILFTYPSDEC